MDLNTEYLRVKQKDTGHEITISRSMYEFAPAAYDVLDDKPATDAGNNPLPPKHKTSVAQSAAAKKATSGQKADPEKES